MSNGKFKPGQSGNPNGRPAGSKNRKTLLREAIEQCGTDLIDRIKSAALDPENKDHMTAALALLARLEAPLRPVAPTVEFEFEASAPLSQQVESVLQAIADGHVAPDVGKQIIDAIGQLAGVRQVDELEARIRALEEHRR